jgi:hypothetical protein
MLLLYVSALIAFFIADLALLAYLENETFYGYSCLKIATGAAIVGGCLFFVGLAKGVDAAITIAINRAGAERPKPLTIAEGGGWQVDDKSSYVNSLLFGEIETDKSISNLTGMMRGKEQQQVNCCESFVDAVFCYVHPVPTPSRRNLYRQQNGEVDSDEEIA